MTNENLLQDLKQFITATVSQQLKYGLFTIQERLDTIESTMAGMATKEGLVQLDEKLDTIQDAIAETFTNTARLERSSA
ncbi:MAG TPA: hypothetical protein VNX65_02535 [Patescibacteria group bacterium]|nr:hypothetical protein [Patescibacteria group bacterium]